MKKFHKYSILFIVVFSIVTVVFVINENKHEDFPKDFNISIPNKPSLVNNYSDLIPYSNISILNDDDLEAFCSSEGKGDGSLGNPYIIENLSINAQSGVGIKIKNISKSLIIRNCHIYNATTALSVYGDFNLDLYEEEDPYSIYIQNNSFTENNYGIWISYPQYENISLSLIITGNYFFDNINYSIYLRNVANSHIFNNYFISNGKGVVLSNSYNNTIIFNLFKGNNCSGVGIEIFQIFEPICLYNKISNNTFITLETGILLSIKTIYLTNNDFEKIEYPPLLIINNNLTENRYGISGEGNYINISYNMINKNLQYGISLFYEYIFHKISITNNLILYNNKSGIQIDTDYHVEMDMSGTLIKKNEIAYSNKGIVITSSYDCDFKQSLIKDNYFHHIDRDKKVDDISNCTPIWLEIVGKIIFYVVLITGIIIGITFALSFILSLFDKEMFAPKEKEGPSLRFIEDGYYIICPKCGKNTGQKVDPSINIVYTVDFKCQNCGAHLKFSQYRG